MKYLFLSLLGLGTSLGLFSSLFNREPIVFESMESKTADGKSVFNQIQFQYYWDRDVWLMRQSHKGMGYPKKKWDRLAIVVNKTKTPYEAKFYQLEPGHLNLKKNFKPIDYKVRCFACHGNGPRAIRPANFDLFNQSFKDFLKVSLWNLRVKSYGRVISTAGFESDKGVGFRAKHPAMRSPLKLKSCLKCHSSTGIRSPLTVEHLATARFLVGHGEMPPYPFSISNQDKKKLNISSD